MCRAVGARAAGLVCRSHVTSLHLQPRRGSAGLFDGVRGLLDTLYSVCQSTGVLLPKLLRICTDMCNKLFVILLSDHTLYMWSSGNSVYAEIYERKCAKSRLINFYKTKHADSNFGFWPNMAGYCALSQTSCCGIQRIKYSLHRREQKRPKCSAVEAYRTLLEKFEAKCLQRKMAGQFTWKTKTTN